MALSDIEIYTPPGIDQQRLRIRRAHGEAEPAFAAVEEAHRRLMAEAKRRRDQASQ